MKALLVASLMLCLAACGGSPAPAPAEPATAEAQAPAAPAAPATADAVATSNVAPASSETATFASGCFWCTESDFDKVKGVLSTTSGYTGGRVANPTYQQVSGGGTGHVESVEIVFDPSVVTYDQLLDVYWHNVDPFSAYGQFCDFGEQYRPVIWVHDAAQRRAAEQSLQRVAKLLGGRQVVVGIEEAKTFYRAEDYHQDYHTKNPVRYNYYRWGCGRDARLADIWRNVTS